MLLVEKEARRLVAELLKKNGYICSEADMKSIPGYEWPKLPGLVQLVSDLLVQPPFVPTHDTDEIAVWKMEAGRPNRWREEQSLDMVKEYWPDTFASILRVYRAGKEASRG